MPSPSQSSPVSRSRSGWLVRGRDSRLDLTGLDSWICLVCVCVRVCIIIFCLFGIDRLSRVPWSINGEQWAAAASNGSSQLQPVMQASPSKKVPPDTLATGANGSKGQEQA